MEKPGAFRSRADDVGGLQVEAVMAVARDLDAYMGAAADVRPALGMVAVPLRLMAELRVALAGAAR